ncbi:MAG: prepilin-type N-terminal cleavage/methylation domain-containing protein [Woeseiaceae bacterium]
MLDTERKYGGFTLIELLIAISLAAMILLGTSGLVKNAISTDENVAERNQLQQDARFALERMVKATRYSRNLLLPLADNPNTNWPENVREQTIPATAPSGSSVFASAVLAVTLPAYVDLDSDGFPDADDDRDGQIDEDLPNDVHHDFMPGIIGIDDDGDGYTDENSFFYWDDDEDGPYNDDPIDGIDNDGDGSIDEDPPTDMNGDGCPGICGVDDDSSGVIDGGNDDNDDEQGGSGFEDAYDPLVYYLIGNSLMERMPVPWNEDGNSSPDGPVDGRDFVESVIADNVTRFRVERPVSGPSGQLVELTLELTGPTGAVVSLSSQVRIGGAL